jgi:hypothetical protein
MSDLWGDEGFGGGGAASRDDGDDDWDEGGDDTAPGLEDGFDDPDGLDDEDWDEARTSLVGASRPRTR